MKRVCGPVSRTPVWKAFCLALMLGMMPTGSAYAFDFFGLFGRGENLPEPSADALPYDLQIDVVGDDSQLRTAIEDISTLHQLRSDAPPDAQALARRAQGDILPLIDALWGLGYYNASVAIEVAGVTMRVGTDRVDAANDAASPFRGSARVPVRIAIDPAQRFTIRNVAIVEAGTGQRLGPTAIPEDVVALAPGDPASAANILSAQARIVDYYRAQSRPFADIVEIDPVVNHPERVMDLTIAVSPGPVAGLGPITIAGNENVDERVIRSFIYTEPGDPYSPEALAGIRTTVTRIDALASARVRHGDTLDADGNLPLDVEVTERLPRVLGASAQFSTTDGPSTRVYWTHRNLFGGAERLRLEASAFYLTQGGGALFDRRRNVFDDLGGRVSASFMKPALWGTRNDFLADARIERDRADGFDTRLVNVTAGLRHRFSDTFNIQAGIEYEHGITKDDTRKRDYRLVGIPLTLEFDSSDSRLEPTEGIRLSAGVTPYAGALGSSLNMVKTRFDLSTYYALDDRARYILAARIGFGSIVGPDLEKIPANRRFFAGGGGSVRGYAYRSLSPMRAGHPIGGRSLIEGSLEARIRITDTIGIVPFIDAGGAFRESYPDFGERLRFAAGLGLRYHTGIGPIRLDFAVPLQKEDGQRGYGIYIGIGQAF